MKQQETKIQSYVFHVRVVILDKKINCYDHYQKHNMFDWIYCLIISTKNNHNVKKNGMRWASCHWEHYQKIRKCPISRENTKKLLLILVID